MYNQAVWSQMQAPVVNAYHYIVLYHRHNVSYAHRFNLLIIRIMIGGGREGVIDMYLPVTVWLSDYEIIIDDDTGREGVLLWHVLSWKCSLECLV